MNADFEMKTREQIGRLKSTALHQIEAEVAQKRIKWFQNVSLEANDLPVSPRRAYDVLFFDYMGLDEEELPIVTENEREIVWLSKNPCPTLEACKALELDTRRVCRGAYEKSTQVLVSQLDPELRFQRSYQDIRPYSPSCREMIIRTDFEHYMRIAIEEAKCSRTEGNKGYGAVMVFQNTILGRAHDTVFTERDPSLHAEVNAIRQAVKEFGDIDLCGAILFSTCEPCPMCTSLAVWANITTIVYGISIEETAQLGKPRIMIPSAEIIRQSPVMIEVIGDILKDECKTLYR
jgi:tRNA(Arg) A34 adenosine deaminase TadA